MNLVAENGRKPVQGSPMLRLHIKLKNLKPLLREFNHKHYGGLSEKVKEKKEKVAHLQQAILSNPTAALISEHKAAKEV